MSENLAVKPGKLNCHCFQTVGANGIEEEVNKAKEVEEAKEAQEA